MSNKNDHLSSGPIGISPLDRLIDFLMLLYEDPVSPWLARKFS